MNKTFYHGTSDYMRILDKGKILCPILLNVQDKYQEKIFNNYEKDYNQLVEKCKKVVLNSEREKEEYLNGSPITGMQDEQLADLIHWIRGEEAYNLYREYKELTRITHIFLGDKQLARSFSEGTNGRILKFEIPEERLRPGYHEGFAMAKKELPLEFLTEIHPGINE